ncbi:MAG: acyltransferase family protein [Marinobacter sp.]|uniref:acyltransferase family protein n=1 Tax=Marinobacter sp. TaxID=50741 RepID=UPI00299E788B|nr:acyltransferase family protein [Marinobacter sp.]MDX1756682.1 acyltransferase family protein [Marinobacter sp.]
MLPAIKYRPEIDGLRAISVASVVFYHAGFDVLSGGYLGVDVFFVISGFLITSIIIKEFQEDCFTLVSFYERRARRIIPALILVASVCIPFSIILMLPDEFFLFSKGLVSVATFSSNILFWLEEDYFSPNVELNPLIHTWSLGVEEQFYLLYPLVFLLVWRHRPSLVKLIVIFFTIISFVLAEYIYSFDQSAAFYLFPARAWELGVGCICAFFFCEGKVRANGFLASLGFVFIIASIFMYDKYTPFPSYYTLLPVVGAACILCFASHDNLVGRILSLGIITKIGLISFSIYLWHQPVFAFVRIYNPDFLGGANSLILIAFVFLLSYLSYLYVEKPFRVGGLGLSLMTRDVFVFSTLAALVLISIGVVGLTTNGLPQRYGSVINKIAASADDRSKYHHCQSHPGDVVPENNLCILGEPNNTKIALLGDSHSAAISQALADAAGKAGVGIIMRSYSGCFPASQLKQREERNCHEVNENNYRYVVRKGIDTVIISARWALYYHDTRYNNGEGGVGYGRILDIGPLNGEFSSVEDKKLAILNSYKATVSRFLDSGVNVILLWDVPEAGWDVPQYLSRFYQKNGALYPDTGSVSFSRYLSRVRDIVEVFETISSHVDGAKLVHVKPSDLLCNTDVPGRCIVHRNGKLLYFDSNHLTNYGAKDIADKVIYEFLDL